ncbi:MAG: hypothetical protein HGB35_06600 [Geobacteraceae bacterium]|nr:hypothetical protein [Geobacteraceae bacterium]
MNIFGCFRKIREMAICISLVVFLSYGSGLSAAPPAAADNCVVCHEDVWRDIQSQRYVHRPDGVKDCKYCHAAALGNIEAQRDVYLNKVKWVARSFSSTREHWLEIEGSNRDATLLVESRTTGGFSLREFPLPAINELEDLPNDELKPLVITNLRILEVSKGVFVSITIGWETNRPSDSQVLYGFDKLDQRSAIDTQYTTNHAVTLTGVKLGRDYKYKGVSVDVAGNRSESNVQMLTAEVLPGSKIIKKSEPDSKDPEVSVKYYRKGGRCVVVIKSESAVNVALGILPKKHVSSNAEGGSKVVRHLMLNSPEVTNVSICYTCHVEYKKILTHPINVYPKRGMIIPPEYATLPDGRITCMSCHVAHASNVEFRLVKADKRDLCRGCHKDIP